MPLIGDSLPALAQALLSPSLVSAIVRKVLTRAIPIGAAADEARAKFSCELAETGREIERLIETLRKIGVSSAVTSALKERENRQGQIERELANLERRDQVSGVELARLEAIAREKVTEWRSLLRRRVPQARQILAKVLREKLAFRPEQRGGQKGYRFTGEGTVLLLLTGLVPDFSQTMASPTGIAPFTAVGRVERRAASLPSRRVVCACYILP